MYILYNIKKKNMKNLSKEFPLMGDMIKLYEKLLNTQRPYSRFFAFSILIALCGIVGVFCDEVLWQKRFIFLPGFLMVVGLSVSWLYIARRHRIESFKDIDQFIIGEISLVNMKESYCESSLRLTHRVKELREKKAHLNGELYHFRDRYSKMAYAFFYF